MKRRAAEVAAIKLCKDNRSSSRSSSIDKTRVNKDLSTSTNKSPDKKAESSPAQNKTDEKKDVVTTTKNEVTTKPRGRRAARQKSAGADENVVNSNRRLNLRSSRPADSRSTTEKTQLSEQKKKKKTSAGHSASSSSSSSSSEADTDESASSNTEVTPPLKQRKIGISNCLVLCRKTF